MKRLLRHLTQLTALACVAFTTAAFAQERTIKFATQNPKGHPIVMGMERFAELVQQRSGGRIKVNLFPGGTLGSDQANVSALQGGTLEMASMNSGILASQVKEFAIFDFPFMFANTREADAVLDGPFGQKMHARLEEKGLVGLAYFELGFRNITNSRRPLNRVEDIAGLKLRVIPNAINVDWVKALDANPTPLPFPEVYAALEQKAIDGQENPLTVINANKFYEVQKFLAITNHQYNPQSVLVSKKFWDTLTPAEQRLLREAAQEAAKYQREQARAQVAQALDNLKKHGMQVTEFPPAEILKFAERMRPVIQKHAASVGEATVNELVAELTKLRR
ncbi:MAG: TRAP transporter substrate-binding protein [Casimicrobiaceae bacterium]|nr:TRAP transporter substrate-binding protein [Casimicrobiaceae bacterium]MCX8098111.1 TRAP transporter substrate-binding protein [Casimicrobiaceae bacterium]MDW8311649.1 TRAP transporter substrate-binding protein [Burkholderiales bacterium]